MRLIVVFLLILLNASVSYGAAYSENVANGCDVGVLYPTNDTARLYATYAPNEHTCAAGYYLPANIDSCVACPAGHTCPGGTYAFNETGNQGINYNFPFSQNINYGCTYPLAISNKNFFATYAPNEHTCAPGYYLPANTDGCVICPANSYCPGGTYTFDETTTQGIETCPNSWYAPRGMSSVDQCGRILHIGENVVYLRSVKKTSPSLHVRVDGYTFYGNMTTADVPMNANTNVSMKVQFNNETYSIYDDTITPVAANPT